MPEIQMIATRSSSFELANSVKRTTLRKEMGIPTFSYPECKLPPISIRTTKNNPGQMMKKAMLVFGILVSLIQSIYGQDPVKSQNAYGVLFMAGGRYDNYRMCVASPAGVKGGAMADIMFTTKHRLNDHRSLTFNLPVMRPVLFGLAFKMLQFEPEMTLEYFLPWDLYSAGKPELHLKRKVLLKVLLD